MGEDKVGSARVPGIRASGPIPEGRIRYEKKWTIGERAQQAIDIERAAALAKHGPLKTGYDRWERLLREEFDEVVEDLEKLQFLDKHGMFWAIDRTGLAGTTYNKDEVREHIIVELAQLAQLCHGCIEHLITELDAATPAPPARSHKGANHGG